MRQKGFTLVEMIVAMFIFTSVLGTVFGLFVTALRSQKRALEINPILNEVSYTLEYIGRALRMAKKDIEGVCIGAKENYVFLTMPPRINFLNYEDNCQQFFLQDGKIKENKSGIVTDLTSDNLVITDFRIRGAGWQQFPADSEQPRLTIFLAAQDKTGSLKFHIQTTLSQRNLDYVR